MKLIPRLQCLILFQCFIQKTFQDDVSEEEERETTTKYFPEQYRHHLGSKDETVQLSKLDHFLSRKAHEQHLRDLELLYSLDDVDTNFGRQFFDREKKSRSKRGGNTNDELYDQNDPGYFALPLPSLPPDVKDNLDKAQLFGRPDRKLIRLANEVSQMRSVLPPVVNPIAAQATAPPPSDSFEPVPKFPGSIQDIMTDMGIHGYPPSDEAYHPTYDNPIPPLQYPPFTHKPSPATKAPEKYVDKPITSKPKPKKKTTTFIPLPEKPTPYPPKSIQDVMDHLGVLNPTYQGYPPAYNAPIVYHPPTTYKPHHVTTKKPKKKKSKKPKTPKHPEKPTEPPAYKPPAPSYKPPEAPSYAPPKPPAYEPPTTPATYVHTRPPEVATFEYHTRAPEPFPTYAPAPPPKSAPKDPNNYMAVIPYDDVYKLFNMLNKHVSPTKMPKKQKRTTTHLPPATTKRTEQLQAKVVKKTPMEGYKKRKRVKPKKTVSVSCCLKNLKYDFPLRWRLYQETLIMI